MAKETKYEAQPASEWSIDQGVNGTGKRIRIHDFYVVNTHENRRVCGFTGVGAEQKAKDWAAFCNEHFG